ncbi:transaldolase [Buchnera aphidicola]|uniref:transaldolase n=1 Tax=Buchnera aphidicola TaxID=9 RepID=UPI0031B8B257
MNQLESLKKNTLISIDSADIKFINKYNPQDATTNPSLILQVIYLKKYSNIFFDALLYANKKGGNLNNKLSNASDKILVNIGVEILKKIPGYISTEIDARLSFNTDLSVLKALKLIKMYKEEGIHRERILIKLAATWEGIKAAEILEKKGIKCNLTLLFSFAQAVACAESNVFLISPFVGRIYDWFNKNNLLKNYSENLDPGVVAVKKIFKYYKKYDYKTIIMGASFRNLKQILSLSGCDRLTISPFFLNLLSLSSGYVKRNLFCNNIKKEKNTNKKLSESEFRWKHNKDIMAVEKLSEGILQFGKDQIQLEKILLKNI